jgi:hypothetical protein
MKTSTAGKILVALAFATMIGGLSMGTALGEDNGRRPTARHPWRQMHFVSPAGGEA